MSADQRRSDELSVPLVHARWRHLWWIVVGVGLGIILITALGTLAVWVGYFLVALGLFHGVQFVRTYVFPPGTIAVAGDRVTLPRGVCRGKPLELPVTDIRHAYFLRRAVPWTRTGPVLVVETKDLSLTYPRDWFASDTEQKQIATALNDKLMVG